MLNNRRYFNYSKDHPEGLFDPYYAKDKIVIPLRAEKKNELTMNNEKLIDLITAFEIAVSMGKSKNSNSIREIIEAIESILDKTENINYSAFCQFFMVYNASYAAYRGLSGTEKYEFLYEILVLYCKERHGMYKSHGYANSILQVVCDSYSHKRNSKTSIIKFEDLLKPYITYNIQDEDKILTDDDYYFLPDKTGKKCFERLLEELDLKMESRAIEQSKTPDMVFKHNGHYYIFECKMMKGGGGGQNKQAVEFAYFIRFSERNDKIHYGILLDSLYSNDLFFSSQPKIAEQRKDVLEALDNNPNNFFVNTAGAELLLNDIFMKD